MFEFRLKEYSEDEVPTPSLVVESAKKFMAQIKPTWTKGKFYSHGGVQTYHTYSAEGDFWMTRESKHKDVSFEEFQKWILENHTENEVKYIPLLDSFKRLPSATSGSAQEWESLIVHYKFPKFFSDREMAIWLLAIQPDPEVKQFFVISLPSDKPVSEHVTQAHYCSIELITFNEESGEVEWIMAQASDARGNIPRWIQTKSVTSSVVADVPHFISWATNNREAINGN